MADLTAAYKYTLLLLLVSSSSSSSRYLSLSLGRRGVWSKAQGAAQEEELCNFGTEQVVPGVSCTACFVSEEQHRHRFDTSSNGGCPQPRRRVRVRRPRRRRGGILHRRVVHQGRHRAGSRTPRLLQKIANVIEEVMDIDTAAAVRVTDAEPGCPHLTSLPRYMQSIGRDCNGAEGFLHYLLDTMAYHHPSAATRMQIATTRMFPSGGGEVRSGGGGGGAPPPPPAAMERSLEPQPNLVEGGGGSSSGNPHNLFAVPSAAMQTLLKIFSVTHSQHDELMKQGNAIESMRLGTNGIDSPILQHHLQALQLSSSPSSSPFAFILSKTLLTNEPAPQTQQQQ